MNLVDSLKDFIEGPMGRQKLAEKLTSEATKDNIYMISKSLLRRKIIKVCYSYQEAMESTDDEHTETRPLPLG